MAARGPCCEAWDAQDSTTTVSFHNFKSRNFKLRVSNPKSKSVAYLSVLSQISNCQSLGRKNKLEILKTDRSENNNNNNNNNNNSHNVINNYSSNNNSSNAYIYIYIYVSYTHVHMHV